jgi:hypothetical protein
MGTPPAKPSVTINPVTGLAMDYLDHLDETVMMLELLASSPQVGDKLRIPQLKTYRQFVASMRGTQRKRAIASYEAADQAACARLDMLVQCMADVLTATREAMVHSRPVNANGMLANRTAAWLRPLVAETSSLINGTDTRATQIVAPEQAGLRLGH